MFRKEVSFVKQAHLAVDAAALFAFLSLPQNRLGLQPLVAEIRDMKAFAAADEIIASVAVGRKTGLSITTASFTV